MEEFLKQYLNIKKHMRDKINKLKLNFKKKFFPIYIFFFKIYLIPQRLYFYKQNIYESNIIKNHLGKYKNIIGVYDLNTFNAPLSIGDFIYFIFFYKYFAISNKKVFIYIIKKNRNLNTFDKILNKKQQKDFINLYFLISRVFIGKNLIDVQFVSWENFEKKKFKDFYMPYKNRIMKQKEIRNFLVAMLNPLLKKKSKKFLKNFLLNQSILNRYSPKIKPKGNYITWHIRQAQTWSFKRNLKENEILSIYKIIVNKFKNMDIVIISDKNGCEFVKKIDRKFNLKLKYCKDMGSSLLSDFYLILNSKCFIAFKGGGAICAAEFSNVPFCCAWTFGIKEQLMNDRFEDINKTQFWHRKNQVWVNSHHIENFLETFKNYRL